MSYLEDFTGQKIGKVTVLYRVPSEMGGAGDMRTLWMCSCEYGQKVTIIARDLKRLKRPSCKVCHGKKIPKYDYSTNVNGFIIKTMKK